MGTQKRMSKKKIGTTGRKISSKPRPKARDDMSKGKTRLPFKLS